MGDCSAFDPKTSFTATSVEILSQLLFKPPPVPSSHRPDLPADIDNAVLALLAKSPAERPGAETVSRRLRSLAARLS